MCVYIYIQCVYIYTHTHSKTMHILCFTNFISYCIYILVFLSYCVCVYIYIYIYSVCIYIYIYTHTHSKTIHILCFIHKNKYIYNNIVKKNRINVCFFFMQNRKKIIDIYKYFVYVKCVYVIKDQHSPPLCCSWAW